MRKEIILLVGTGRDEEEQKLITYANNTGYDWNKMFSWVINQCVKDRLEDVSIVRVSENGEDI